MEDKIKRLARWLKGEESPPFKIVLNPTNRCNLKCMFCPNALPRSEAKFKAEDELIDEKWAEVVDNGLKLGVREWSIIGGGEPLLRHTAVFSMIRSIKNFDNKIDCELITNGTLFRKGDIENLVNMGMDRILFSIDAPDAETHNYLRGVEKTFENSVENLKLFSAIKEKLKSDKPYLKINMVLNNRNHRKIERMVEFIKNVGAQELALHPMREYDELNFQIKKLKLNSSQEMEIKEEIIRAERLSRELGVSLNRDMVNLEKNNSINQELTNINPESANRKEPKSELSKKITATNCFEPFYTLFIDPSGNVAQCSPAGSGYKELNVRDKSLQDIWYSKKLSSIRKLIGAGGRLECCLKCGLTDMREAIRKELLEFLGRSDGL